MCAFQDGWVTHMRLTDFVNGTVAAAAAAADVVANGGSNSNSNAEATMKDVIVPTTAK